MLKASTVKFLKDLDRNNNKAWFEGHRTAYEDARDDFSTFIQSVIDKHGKNDEEIASLTTKQCLFRINRDIRFSKDKRPYKNNFGASIDRGGKKSIFAGYYFHLQPGDSFAGGGIWMPQPAELKKIRQEIDYNFDEFQSIIRSKKFVAAFGSLTMDGDVSLVNIPKGYEKDNPAADYIKLKSYLGLRKISDAELTDKGLLKITVQAFEALQPLIKFINRSLEA
jgi:uncharacterized protein (TIGR02453 family)